MDDFTMPLSPPDVEQTPQKLYEYAISLLARREYSRAELLERCQRRTTADEMIDAVIERLQQENLQSDERFAAVFVRSRIARRQGPRRIANDMKIKGIANSLVSETLQTVEVDWYLLACEALAARFAQAGTDLRERAKRQRFLAGRGFDIDHIQHALHHAWSASE